MKIGILGGTFNPIHIGHLILAEEVRERIGLDKIIFVPTNLPPHKDNSEIALANDRYKMIRLAIKNNKHFFISNVEIRRKGKSYTIDTIKKFKDIYSDSELYFITGSDLLRYLDDWKDIREVLGLVKFIVASRPGYSLQKIPSYLSSQTGIQTLDIRAVDVSAFEIRKAIKENKSFRYLVPEPVFNYINKKRLYRCL